MTANHSVLHTDVKVKLLKKLRREANDKYRLKKNVLLGKNIYSIVKIDFSGEWDSETVVFDSKYYDVAIKHLDNFRTNYVRRKVEMMKYGKTGIFLDV